ncbi:MAG: prepilin-type N-terminal cleavage/methylation domain-containing protein [Opitutae bacterium]|nr:prepilin-type N-terminal cleavage/methylation domain-containing protein [Opitutae bacterium]
MSGMSDLSSDMVSRRSLGRGFSLLELLVVIGLIAGLTAFLVSGIGRGGKSTSLQSGQAMLANLVTAARTKALATGRKTRLLVQADAAAAPASRFLRLIVMQLARQSGPSPANWDTIEMTSLPESVYAMPSSLTLANGLVAVAADWKKTSAPAADLVSDLFSGQSISVTLEGETVAQTWTGVAFTANGTLAPLAGGFPPKGTLVLALGVVRAPGSYATGDSPVQLTSPQSVRGLSLSAYGVPALLNDRAAF